MVMDCCVLFHGAKIGENEWQQNKNEEINRIHGFVSLWFQLTLPHC